MNPIPTLLCRRARVIQEMDALWPPGRACIDYTRWFALFRRHCNLNLALLGRKS